jgi:hypothetical protein
MTMKRVNVLCFALFLSAALSLRAQNPDCEECKAVLAGGVFNTTNVVSTQAAQDAFTAWECTTNFSSAQEAMSNGLTIGVPIYGVPVKLGDNYSDEQKKEWKSEHCSNNTSNSQSFSRLVVVMKLAAPAILQAWTQCIENTCGGPKAALSCSVKSQAGGAIFRASWLRTAGDNAAPKVEFFRAYDAKCDPHISRMQTISEAGVALKCDIPVNQEGVFILQTTRGTCAPSAYGRTSLETISGEQTLTGPKNYKAEKIVFSSDAILITNGQRLTFEASEIEIQGAPKILSYEPGTGTGRSAGPIQIKADRITGTSIQIQNTGENGSKGADGAAGAPGPPGHQGYQRDWDITGCHGGSNGTPGGQGGTGGDGAQGQAGGNGGTVIYDIGSGIQDGAIQRLVVVTDGGKGGAGGAAGPGGPGGPGGQGAPGSRCGGTDPGPNGGVGASGRGGLPGPDGVGGQIIDYRAGGTP